MFGNLGKTLAFVEILLSTFFFLNHLIIHCELGCHVCLHQLTFTNVLSLHLSKNAKIMIWSRVKLKE